MTGLKEGQRMKYQKDGRIFRITKITRDFAVLQALDDSTQVLTGIFSLDFLFEKVPPADSRESRSFRRQTHAAVSERRGKEGTA
jgi:hypothetical protein